MDGAMGFGDAADGAGAPCGGGFGYGGFAALRLRRGAMAHAPYAPRRCSDGATHQPAKRRRRMDTAHSRRPKRVSPLSADRQAKAIARRPKPYRAKRDRPCPKNETHSQKKSINKYINRSAYENTKKDCQGILSVPYRRAVDKASGVTAVCGCVDKTFFLIGVS